MREWVRVVGCVTIVVCECVRESASACACWSLCLCERVLASGCALIDAENIKEILAAKKP